MIRRTLVALGLVAAIALAPGFVYGQTGSSDLPRTPWGDPDLQGVWNNNTVVPLERPDDLAGQDTLTDEQVAERFQQQSDALFTPREGNTGFYNEFWFEYGQDTNRTSLIIDPPDGKLPALTSRALQGQQELQARRGQVYEAPHTYLDLHTYDRCITRGMPGAMMPGFYNHNYHILQTPNYVAIVVEMIHDARIIPLDGRPHVSPHVQQWLGDSRGRWEGDTLVVETTNLNDVVNEHGTLNTVLHIGEGLRLVERFTRVGPDTIDYRYTVHDPTVYEGAWTAAVPMNKIDGTLFEYACHEGNYAMPNMLGGARAEEAAASAQP